MSPVHVFRTTSKKDEWWWKDEGKVGKRMLSDTGRQWIQGGQSRLLFSPYLNSVIILEAPSSPTPNHTAPPPRYNIILYHLTQKQLNNTINIFKSWAAKLSENLLLMFRSSSDPNKARFESFQSYFFGLISPVHNQITINKAKY